MSRIMPNEFNTGSLLPPDFRPSTVSFPYSFMIDQQTATRVPEWGFVVYRGVYDSNDAEWDVFLRLLKDSVATELQFQHLEEELGPTLQWTIIEDRETLAGASIDLVRVHFLNWVAEQTKVPYLLEKVPRFKYCLFVDKTVYETIHATPCEQRNLGWQFDLASRIIVVDGTYPHGDPDDEDTDEEEEEEGLDEDYIDERNKGWALLDLIAITELYAMLCASGTQDSHWRTVSSSRAPNENEKPSGQTLSAVTHALQNSD